MIYANYLRPPDDTNLSLLGPRVKYIVTQLLPVLYLNIKAE
jgi:hypothetical protein